MVVGSCLREGPESAWRHVRGAVVEATLEGGGGWTLDLIPRAWGSHAEVLSIGVTGSDEWFLKTCEPQCVPGRAFPLGRETWKHTPASCGVGESGSGWDLPQGCVRSWKGGLPAVGLSGWSWRSAVSLPGFSSTFTGCRPCFQALVALGAAPLSVLSLSGPIFRWPQVDTQPSVAQPGCKRESRLLDSQGGVGAASVHEAS